MYLDVGSSAESVLQDLQQLERDAVELARITTQSQEIQAHLR